MDRLMKIIAAMLAFAMLIGTPCGAEGMSDAQAAYREKMLETREAALGVEINASVKAKDITGKCKISVSRGDRSRLTDGKVSTGWKDVGKGDTIEIALPDGITPGMLCVDWMFDPAGFELTEYDASGNALRTRTQDDAFPSIAMSFALLPEARAIKLTHTAKDQVIVEIAVYTEGLPDDSVQTWLPPVEKADLMAISTHQDDEVLWFGGTIPYSDVVCGRPTVTMYMANCSRLRRQEALDCLWAMGSRHYPEFLNLQDEKVGSLEAGIKLWGGKDALMALLVDRIRRYKPEVIVTHDFDGEYGHKQHVLTAKAVPYAVEAAADPTQYPESAEKYGAWQVKKLYIHLYNQNKIKMDWQTPLDVLGGKTLFEVAKLGFSKHASQTDFYVMKKDSQYDNSAYGLYATTVGPDVACNDFFENIPSDASASYIEETPAPMPEATPVAEEAATPEPTDLPEETPAPTVDPPAPAVGESRKGPEVLPVALAAVAVLGGGAGLYMKRAADAKKKKKKKKRRSAGKHAAKQR